MKKQLTVLILVTIIFNSTLASNENPKYMDTSLDFQTRAADLVSRMTLKEKISQMGNNASAISRLGVAKYGWMNECLHGVARAGHATVFPQAIGLAASFDRAEMYKVACIISDEARAKHHDAIAKKSFGSYRGLTFWSPNINIFRDPRWGRGQETYGEDPYLTGQMGIQFVKGLQGDDPKYLKLVATAKHFAVHSGPEPERHTFDAVVNARDLWETYLPAFADLVTKAKVYSVMGAYSSVDGQCGSASWMLLQDILRRQWGFEGYVVSDCTAISDIYKNHKLVDTAAEAAAVGVRRGCDLSCGGTYKPQLMNAIKAGYISEGEIDLAVFRLMLARMKLGMFDPPSMVPYAQIPLSVNDSAPHDKVALEMARKSMTLLKNENSLLPLNRKKIKKIAIIGPNAKNVEALKANYSGEPSNPVTVFDGISKAAGNSCQVLYARGCGLVKNDDSFSQAVEYTRQADVAIFVGGLDASLEREQKTVREEGFFDGDRTKIELPQVQLDLLKAMLDTNTPVIFVLSAGSAVAFDGLEEELPVILMAWYPGQRGGDAVADVLFGDYSPAGRLPITFYRSTAELPDFRDYYMAAGKGRTYRYYTGKPLYPFGHGLSYTKFEYSDMKISKKTLGKNDSFTVSVKIKNVGSMPGDEVAQLYVRDIESSLPMPIKKLRGFERVSIEKGKTKTVAFKLNVSEDLRYYEPRLGRYNVESGQFQIQVCASSEDIRLKDMVVVK